MKRKILSMLLTTTMLVAALPIQVVADEPTASEAVDAVEAVEAVEATNAVEAKGVSEATDTSAGSETKTSAMWETQGSDESASSNVDTSGQGSDDDTSGTDVSDDDTSSTDKNDNDASSMYNHEISILDENMVPVETYDSSDFTDSYTKNLSDNDTLMAGYIEKLFYGETDVPASETTGTANGPRRASAYSVGSNVLTGDNLIVYNYLKPLIAEVANGTRDQAQFEIPIELLVEKTSMTMTEMGQTWGVESGYLVGVDYSPLTSQVDVSWSLVMSALLRDCPYELYWYDKTDGFMISGPRCSASASYTSNGSVTGYVFFLEGANYTLTFDVAESYLKSTSSGTHYDGSDKYFFYEVDTTNINRVQTALTNANGIVSSYVRYDDYSKLVGYKDSICEMVDYNHPAADNKDTPFGDPWQLVYVFDGDTSTKVVCEGYSKAFQYLCDQTTFADSAVHSYIVTGTMRGATGEGGHMWNIVHMDDGKNYLVDVTNSDSDSVGGRGGLFLNGVDYYEQSQCIVPNNLNSQSNVYYWYDSDTKNLFTSEELELSATDYNYTGTGEPIEDEDPIQISGCSISIFDDTTLKVNLYVRVADSTEESYTAQAAFADVFGSEGIYGDGTEQIDFSSQQPVETGEGYKIYRIAYPVNSGEMTRDVKFQICDGDDEVVIEAQLSAAEIFYSYLDDDFEINNPGYEASYYIYVRNVSKAALNYGTAAQQYFGNWFDADGTLANAELSTTEKNLAELTDSELTATGSNGGANTNETNGTSGTDYRNSVQMTGDASLTYRGSTLLLTDQVMIRHYFALDEGYTADQFAFRVSLGGTQNKTLTPQTKGSLLYVEFPASIITLTRVDTLQITNYESANVISASVLKYSLMNYIGRVTAASENNNMKTLVTALYWLGESLG